jgi:tRNA(adenine34) deaminase
MTFSEDNYKFMSAALKEAEKAFEAGEVPIGAVVINQNKVIGKGFNQVEKLKDATAHAEMIALTAASENLGNWRLNECDLYVTVEPCIMCAGAILVSRVRNLYFGTMDTKFGACGSVFDLLETDKYNHKVSIYSGILETESRSLLEEFFVTKRIEQNRLK